MQDISKHYSFSLDTKATKLLKSNLVFNYGDDITLKISVIEDGQPKDLTNCQVDLVVANQGNNIPIIHKFEEGGISTLENVVTIVCKDSYINSLGVNIGQLIIRDTDQNITTQSFLYVTNSTLISDEMINAAEQIDTLIKLNKIIEETELKLEDFNIRISNINNRLEQGETLIDNSIKDLDNKVVMKTNEVDNIVTEFEKSIQNRIDGVEETVNYQLVRNTKLKPIEISGSTTIGFETKPIEVVASELVRSAYDFHVSGCSSSQLIVQSSTGHIIFFQEVVGSKPVIKARMSTIVDISIQGKQITPSIAFIKDGAIVDSLNINDINYKILIKANIHINNIETGECYMTPLSRNILK
ncbi:BppU family phage baseplate upper protein [Paraclostridium bifermentans]|uniref:BppU family phage baseplate upper protein n=1 Tax=Paraclostridium bifermentans TaxID=1490 RepID=UPI00189F771B|nr:BppU family phage baseplate upper protein [Paraclostridium bifermentans]